MFIWTWWWAVVPIIINISAAMQQGTSVTPMTVLVTGVTSMVFGMAAPILFHRAFCDRNIERTWALVILGLIALSVNLINAIDSAAKTRESRSDHSRVTIDRRGLLTGRDQDLGKQIAALQKISQDDPVGTISAYILKLKSDPLYARSAQCSNVTMTDSSGLCIQLRGAEGRLAAAVKIDELSVERKVIWGQLTELESAPLVADPGLDTVVTLAGQFGAVDERLVQAGVNGWVAIALELLCTFMPAMLGRRQPLPKTVTEEPRPATVTVLLPKTVTNPAVLWLEERGARGDGGTRGSVAQDDFKLWCRNQGISLPRNWPSLLKEAIIEAGYEREQGAYVTYRGLVLRGRPLLEVVKA